MTLDDIKNKLSTSEEEYDENKLTISMDLRPASNGEYESIGLTLDYIYTEALNALVDEYIESFLKLQRKISDYPWEGNEFESAIITNLFPELSNIKKNVIESLFKDDDELINYLKKKINIKVYV